MIVWWAHKNDTNRILLHYSVDIGASETHEYIEMVCASLYWDHHNFNIRHIIQQKQQQTKEKLQLMRHTHSSCNCVREQLFIQFIFELFFYPSSSIRAITSCQIHMYREYKVYTLNSFKHFMLFFSFVLQKLGQWPKFRWIFCLFWQKVSTSRSNLSHFWKIIKVLWFIEIYFVQIWVLLIFIL